MILLGWFIACSARPPFEAVVRIDGSSAAPPPKQVWLGQIWVKNDSPQIRWVLFGDPLDASFEPLEVRRIDLTVLRGNAEWEVRGDGGRSWHAFRVEAEYARTQSTRLESWGRTPLDSFELWTVSDVQLPGGETLDDLARTVLADPGSTDPHPGTSFAETRASWTPEESGFAVLVGPEHRTMPLLYPP